MPDPENTNLEPESTEDGGELQDSGRDETIGFIESILGKREGGTTEESIAGEPITELGDPFEDEESLDIDEPEEEGEPEGEDPTEEWEEVDPRFVDAAREYGWSDKQIQAYAEKHEAADLIEITGLMERETESVNAQLEETEEGSEEGVSAYDSLLDKLNTASQDEKGSELAEALKAVVLDLKEKEGRHAKLQEQLERDHATREKAAWDGRVAEADEAFDTLAKDFPELGSSKKLPRLPDGTLLSDDPAVSARVEIFDEAVFRFKTKGETWAKALNNAVRWYRGGHEEAVEDKVLKKIKAGSKRVSPKRHRRQQTQQYATEIDRKKAVINQALAKYGEQVD